MNWERAFLVTLLFLVGFSTVILRAQRVEAGATIYIRVDGSIDPPTANITGLDDVTYYFTDNINDSIVVERDNIVIDGGGYTLQGAGVFNSRGMDLSGRTNVTVRNTQISNFFCGIFLSSSSGNGIIGNNLTENTFFGIVLESSSFHNSVSGNSITANNDSGIVLSHSSNNSVSENSITANNLNGIVLSDASNYNDVSRNNLKANGHGIWLEFSFGNMLYHNNFIDNSEHAWTRLALGPANVWDDGYPSGGNYWSGYADNDVQQGPYQNETGSDGMRDSAYIVPRMLPTPPEMVGVDRYPLMGMFYSFNVTYYTPPLSSHNCTVEVVSNSTISNFEAPIWIEHPDVIFLRFNVNGADGSLGFCRVSFPTAMMNGTYGVLINGTEIPFTLLECSSDKESHLYFNYTHSTKEVVIVSEFPSLLVLPLTFTAGLLSAIVHRRKHA